MTSEEIKAKREEVIAQIDALAAKELELSRIAAALELMADGVIENADVAAEMTAKADVAIATAQESIKSEIVPVDTGGGAVRRE